MSTGVSRRAFLSGASALAVAAGLGLAGCGSSSDAAQAATTGAILAVGSTAMQPLMEAAAEAYGSTEQGASVSISVQGGGSGQGLTQVSEGTAQIGDSDVFAEAKITDADKLAALVDHQVAICGMGPVAHPDCGVENVSLADLKAVFMGQVTNWSELGGADLAITVINRAAGSGTRATFEQAVLGGDEVPSSFTPQEQDSSGTVAKMVKATPGAISYLAFSYFADDILALSIDGVAPTRETVEQGEWPIWAYMHAYTQESCDQAVTDFIDYLLSDNVQGSLVESVGFIPVADMTVAKDADGTIRSR